MRRISGARTDGWTLGGDPPCADGRADVGGGGHLGLHRHDVQVHQVVEEEVQDAVVCGGVIDGAQPVMLAFIQSSASTRPISLTRAVRLPRGGLRFRRLMPHAAAHEGVACPIARWTTNGQPSS